MRQRHGQPPSDRQLLAAVSTAATGAALILGSVLGRWAFDGRRAGALVALLSVMVSVATILAGSLIVQIKGLVHRSYPPRR